MAWEDLLARARGQTEQEAPEPVCLADVDPQRVSWLWHPYLPMGKITLLEGDPGQGKSYLTAALATALSRGAGLPGWNAPRPAMRTLMLSTEDGLADTLRPRLDDMGADSQYIHAYDKGLDLSGVGMLGLEDMITRLEPSLVTIDPLVSYVGSKTDTYRANEVRSIMAPLAKLAERFDCSILGVRHLTKGNADTPALYRGQGSIDFAAAARSVLFAGADKEAGTGARHVVHIKSSLAAPGISQGYKLDRGKFHWLNLEFPAINPLLPE